MVNIKLRLKVYDCDGPNYNKGENNDRKHGKMDLGSEGKVHQGFQLIVVFPKSISQLHKPATQYQQK